MAKFLDLEEDYEGLSDFQAANQLAQYGLNTDDGREDNGATSGETAFAPLLRCQFLVLLFALVFSAVGAAWFQFFVISACVVAYIGIELYEDRYCRSVRRTLRAAVGVLYRVVRDGKITLLRGETIVQDDILLLGAGETVPADAEILEMRDVTVDESLFTGDKNPVAKTPEKALRGKLRLNAVYKGTKICSGYCSARVFSIGQDTAKTRLNVGMDEDVVFEAQRAVSAVLPPFSIFCLVLLVMATAYEIFMGSGKTLVCAAVLALCAAPAESAFFIKAHYARCAKYISRNYGLIKDDGVIDKINAVNVLYVDGDNCISTSKTDIVAESTQNSRMLANVAVMSCDASRPTAFDKAILLGATFRGIELSELHAQPPIKVYVQGRVRGILREYNGARLLCVKGSPEEVFALCELTPDKLYAEQSQYQSYGNDGLRCLAVAYAIINGNDVPDSLYKIKFQLMGQIAFKTDINDGASAAVHGCYQCGVDVALVTAEHPNVAEFIAKKIGLIPAGIITGDDLRKARHGGKLPDARAANIYADIGSNRQKTQIIERLQDAGAFIGVFGVSDANLLVDADFSVALESFSNGEFLDGVDLVLRSDDFRALSEIIGAARQNLQNVCESVMLAFFCSAAVTPLALLLFLTDTAKLAGVAGLVALNCVVAVPLLCAAILFRRVRGKAVSLRREYITTMLVRGGVASVVAFLFAFAAPIGVSATNAMFLTLGACTFAAFEKTGGKFSTLGKRQWACFVTPAALFLIFAVTSALGTRGNVVVQFPLCAAMFALGTLVSKFMRWFNVKPKKKHLQKVTST